MNEDAQIAIKAESTETEVSEESVYVPQVYEYDTDYQWINSIVALDEENLLLFGQWYDNRPYSEITRVNTMTGETGEYAIELAEERYIGRCIDTDDGYVVFSESYAEDEAGTNYGLPAWEGAHLSYFDENFKLVSEMDITDFCCIANGKSTFYFDYMSMDKEGNAYFSWENDIHVVDKNGRQLAKIGINGTVQSMISVGKQVLVLYRDKGGAMVAVSVDVQKERLGEPLKNIPDCGYLATLIAGEEEYFYIAAQDSLFVYDADRAECKEVVKWLDCDLNGLGQLCIAIDERIISTSCGNMSYELILLDKVKKSEVEPKSTLTVAMIQNDSYMTEQFMKFNRMSKDYRLEPKIYVTEESPEALEAAIQQFNMDLISGDVGDIVFVTRDLDFINLASKGAFVDLDALLEQDTELDKSDFIENIVDTLSVDGKLYGIAPYFTLNTLVGKTANVGTADSWNVTDVWNMMEQHEDAVLMYGMRKFDVLGMFLRYNMSSYYNAQTGECYFDSEAFKTLLEIANCFPAELNLDEVNAGLNDDSAYVGDARLLAEFLAWYGVYALQHYRVIFGEEINIIGYPVDEGLGISVSFGNGLYAISASSEKKEAAWQFIRQYLLEEHQEGYIDYGMSGVVQGFPIRKDVFEQGIADAMEEAPDGEWIHGDIRLELEPLSESDAEYFRKLVYRVTRNSFTDYRMYNIIMEEAGAYFSGQKTVDEVAAIIQNRVQLYLDENK